MSGGEYMADVLEVLDRAAALLRAAPALVGTGAVEREDLERATAEDLERIAAKIRRDLEAMRAGLSFSERQRFDAER